MNKITVGELIKELEKLDKDKPVELSVNYDNCDHIQDLCYVDDFKDSLCGGKGWVTLIGKSLHHNYKENEELRRENKMLKDELEMYKAPNCRKCMNYCNDKSSDYCLCDERKENYFAFPFGWNYVEGAKECEYYEE